VQRLVDAGAVIVGKANLNEFARGVTTSNPFFGDCANPVRPGYSPGGSSGGNAAAVAAGLAPIGLATDAGGSSRAPAAACRVAGFKPSYGVVSLEGAFPLAAPFDHAGVIARSIDDCALLMEVLTGLPRPDVRVTGLRVGITHPIPEPDDLTAIGMRLDEVSLPPFDDVVPVHLVEFAYSHRALYPARADEYTPECRAMLDRGRAVGGLEYRIALDCLREWRAECERRLVFDLLVSPTLPGDPPKLREPETLDMLLRMSSLTRPYNLLGWPAAVTRDGLMFAGRSDAIVLGAALAWEAQLSDR
jgi:aspartyl-tRNA(Asn)/glutamyl-tRNA(Gln) amidotransferase subunit A